MSLEYQKLAGGEEPIYAKTNEGDTYFTSQKCEACSAREQEHGYGVICEHATPQEKQMQEDFAKFTPEQDLPEKELS